MIDYTLPLSELPDPLPIEPLRKPFDVTITPPGSKSITNRAYVLAALADGESKLIRPLRSDDCDALLDALCTLGASARWAPGDDGDDVYITGVAGRFPRGGNVNLGDGGTPTRFMIACACLAAEPVVVDGSARMRERPIAEGVDMLRELGADIEYIEEEGRLPVRVSPSDEFKGGELTIGKTASSQFVSALMLIGPWLDYELVMTFDKELTSRSYIILTEEVLFHWGIDTQGDGEREIRLYRYDVQAQEYRIESDASSASYWFTAAAIRAKCIARIQGLTPESQQGDIDLLSAIDDLGMIVSWDNSEVFVEGTGGCRSKDSEKDKFDFEFMPDASLAFAVCASVQAFPICLTGLHTLRVKETDRIAALANELRRVGCDVATTDDSITITPMAMSKNQQRAATVRERERGVEHEGRPLPHGRSLEEERGASKGSRDSSEDGRGAFDPVIIETYNDHRMAMAFAVLGLARPGISIRNPACVAKSYPGFWRDFARLYE